MKLCVITTRNERFTHEDIARFAVDGGADCVQFRKKEGSTRELVKLALRVREIVSGRATYIVDDRIDVALACEADGVHIGKEDMPLVLARRICPGKIMGYSVDSPEDAIEAERMGASYLGAGPVFATKNKSEENPIWLEGLHRLCESVSIPVIAIGGITLGNVKSVMDAGADGVAVISAIADAEDPLESVRAFVRILNSYR
jgi:thiamine-phosphate pyrophosphorylase